jgi:hypothetical protein
MDYTTVRKIEVVHGWRLINQPSANDLLDAGWVLLGVSESREGPTMFSMGWNKESEPVYPKMKKTEWSELVAAWPQQPLQE